MNTLGSGLQAALLLARGRPDGLGLLAAPPNAAMDVATRSFWALPAALPGFVALRVLDWVISGRVGSISYGFAQDLLGFIVGWLAFAVLSHRIALVSGRAALWPRYIAAWNWCNVVQYLMLVIAALPVLLGAPDWLVQTCWLVATGWALWLEYFVTRLALALPVGQAVAMVSIDFGLGLAIAVAIAGFN